MPSHSRYEILEKIASGSFATVYRGRDLELGREVAIKQIHEQYLEDPKQLERYWQEAQLLASFQHPNIVTIYDIVRERGWLVLELMQTNLSKVAGRKSLDLDSVRSTLAHCLRALRFLHSHGIVHGDIKPSNLMIDRRKRIKIGDFGLARRVSDDEGSLIKGTTKYMAPEVVTDDFGDVGPASDLYSLGFVAYELMCGENFESLFPGLSAFGRDKQIAWMMWHAAPDRRLPEISRTLEGVPADLAKVVQKLTNKSQAERYKSADEALSDLNIDIKLIRGDASEDATSLTGGIAANPAKKKRLLAIGGFAASFLLCVLVLFWDSFRGSGSQAPSRLVGRVRTVDKNRGELILDDEAGTPTKHAVSGEELFRLVDEDDTIYLEELLPDDQIRPMKAGGDPRIVGEVLRPKKKVSGTIVAVDVPQNEFSWELDEGEKRETIVVRLSKSATVTLNDAPAKLADLKPEDRVLATHIRDPEGSATRLVLDLKALRTVREIGFVTEIDAKRIVFEKRGAARASRIVLPLAEDCDITINGQPDRKPTDVKPGERVIVIHDAQVTGLEVSRRKSASGLVIDLDGEKGVLQVQQSDGEQLTFKAEPETEISLSGDKVALDELRRNDEVTVTYDPQEGASPARTIDAVRTPLGIRVALLIAVQNQADKKLTTLETPLADAKLLHDTLTKRYRCAPDRIEVLRDPTKDEFQRRVADWLKTKTSNQSQLVVYFVGNAYKTPEGEVVLAASDTKWDDLESTGVTLRWLADEVDGTVADQRILLFNGSHLDLRSSAAKAGAPRQLSDEEMLKTLGEGQLLKSTTVIGATATGERGQNWRQKGHSLFALALADAFSLKADANRNGLVEPTELGSFLKQSMAALSTELKTTQTPVVFMPE